MHSDQGWQYQHAFYRSELQKYGIIQSMSRKGNYYDNCIMETFFGRLKNEMFYGLEKDYPRRRHQPDSLECLSEGFLLFLRHIGQNIPHEMHLAALP